MTSLTRETLVVCLAINSARQCSSLGLSVYDIQERTPYNTFQTVISLRDAFRIARETGADIPDSLAECYAEQIGHIEREVSA